MRIDLLRDSTLDAMESYMARLSKRQQIVASNIANIDTPGYRTRDVSFHAALGELAAEASTTLRASHAEHAGLDLRLAPREPEVTEVSGLTIRPDGNNVDLDREMLKLSETAFGYGLMAQLVRIKLRTIASSINEGRAG